MRTGRFPKAFVFTDLARVSSTMAFAMVRCDDIVYGGVLRKLADSVQAVSCVSLDQTKANNPVIKVCVRVAHSASNCMGASIVKLHNKEEDESHTCRITQLGFFHALKN